MDPKISDLLAKMRQREQECNEKASLHLGYIANNPASDESDEAFIRYDARCSELRLWITELEKMIGFHAQ